jgi:hypothetical protein
MAASIVLLGVVRPRGIGGFLDVVRRTRTGSAAFRGHRAAVEESAHAPHVLDPQLARCTAFGGCGGLVSMFYSAL